MNGWPRIIVHADMDAFYAAVEQRDEPDLRGKPILIGPRSHRGVVLTASYEARPYNVGSGMPVAEARRRCPEAIMVPPNFSKYQAVSAQVMQIFGDFSPKVEALSLDEAFIDMSGAEHIFGPPQTMGKKIKDAVYQATGLHISVGISGTKYVAKVASAWEKPQGLTVVAAAEAKAWLAPMPVSRLWGVGKKTAPRLNELGFFTIGDIAEQHPAALENLLGRQGVALHALANAQDPRQVSRGRGAKSIGSDRTLNTDITDPQEIKLHLRRAAERVARRLRGKTYCAQGVRIRLKTTAFQMLSRQKKLPQPLDTADGIYQHACQLLKEMDHPGPFRLVGLAVFDLDWAAHAGQGDLFTDQAPRELETTVDKLIERFGQQTLMRASDLLDHGTVAKNGMNLDFLDFRDGERVAHPASKTNQ